VMGAVPMMVSIALRTTGILAGAVAMRWLVRQDMAQLRQRLRRLVPWLIVPYLLALMQVNRLLSLQWLSLQEAVNGAYQLGLLPLFDYYIVSKAAAAKNIVGHVLLYLPVGAGLWLYDRDPNIQRRGRGAFLLAALLSLCIETGRYFRPGLEGDINAVAIAGLSAMLAARLMPKLWSMLTGLALQSASDPAARKPAKRQWDKRGPPAPRDSRPVPLGEIEEY
jgi:VanZ family protein